MLVSVKVKIDYIKKEINFLKKKVIYTYGTDFIRNISKQVS